MVIVSELIERLQRYRPNAYVKLILGVDVCEPVSFRMVRGGCGVHIICKETHSNFAPPSQEEMDRSLAEIREQQKQKRLEINPPRSLEQYSPKVYEERFLSESWDD